MKCTFPAGPLGLSISDTMVVLRVVEGGVADKGGVRAGMQLVGLNSTSLRGIPTPEALNMIKNSSRPLVLEFTEATKPKPTPAVQPVPAQSKPETPPSVPPRRASVQQNEPAVSPSSQAASKRKSLLGNFWNKSKTLLNKAKENVTDLSKQARERLDAAVPKSRPKSTTVSTPSKLDIEYEGFHRLLYTNKDQLKTVEQAVDATNRSLRQHHTATVALESRLKSEREAWGAMENAIRVDLPALLQSVERVTQSIQIVSEQAAAAEKAITRLEVAKREQQHAVWEAEQATQHTEGVADEGAAATS